MTKTLPLLLILSLLTCCIEVDISVPGFPEISDYFNISDGLTQMTVAVNFFAFCISSIICGPLSDSYGRRLIMIVGNGIMLIGAIGCVIANNIEFLLFSRFIQGLGASTSCVVVFAMIADVYPADKAAKLIGTMNSLMSMFMTLAPIAGGFINSMVGFRGNYSAVAIVSLISWLMLYFKLPETKEETETFQLTIIIKNFYILLSDRRFIYASLPPSITYSGYLSFITCMPFLYMETYNQPMMFYAINQGIILAAFSIFSLYAGNISNFLGEKNCVIYGTVLLLSSGIFGLLMGLFFADSAILVTCSVVIFAIGAAITYPIIFTKSLEIFPNIKGTASSAIMAIRALLCGLSIGFTSYIYDGTLLNVSLGVLLSTLLTSFCTFKLLKIISFATKK